MPVGHERDPRAAGSRRRTIVGVGLAAAAGVLLIAAAAPLFGGWPALAAGARLALHGLCHQLPERSFGEGSQAMALCHRCTGIYAGVGLGGLLAALGLAVDPRSVRMWVLVGGAMALQVLSAWVVEAVDLWPLRVLTGLLVGGWGGLALASAFGSAQRYSSDSTSARSPETTSGVAP